MGSVEINLCALHGTQSNIKKTLGFSTMLILLITHGVLRTPLFELYTDEIHRWIGLKGEQLIHRVDKLKRGWSR